MALCYFTRTHTTPLRILFSPKWALFKLSKPSVLGSARGSHRETDEILNWHQISLGRVEICAHWLRGASHILSLLVREQWHSVLRMHNKEVPKSGRVWRRACLVWPRAACTQKYCMTQRTLPTQAHPHKHNTAMCFPLSVYLSCFADVVHEHYLNKIYLLERGTE